MMTPRTIDEIVESHEHILMGDPEHPDKPGLNEMVRNLNEKQTWMFRWLMVVSLMGLGVNVFDIAKSFLMP